MQKPVFAMKPQEVKSKAQTDGPDFRKDGAQYPRSGRSCVRLAMEQIVATVKPLADKYRVKEIYLFGSYARGEADENSDLDFLVFGGEMFKRTMIFALAEDLRETLKKKVDVFEIGEVNLDSDFYKRIMKEKVLIA